MLRKTQTDLRKNLSSGVTVKTQKRVRCLTLETTVIVHGLFKFIQKARQFVTKPSK